MFKNYKKSIIKINKLPYNIIKVIKQKEMKNIYFLIIKNIYNKKKGKVTFKCA